MKRFSLLFLLISAVVVMNACGGSSSSTTTSKTTVSHIKKRVLVANEFTGQNIIVNGATDTVSAFNNTSTQTVTPFTIVTGSKPAIMLTALGHITIVYDAAAFAISFIDPVAESVVAAIQLDGSTDSIALSSDGKFAYAAIRNSAEVEAVDIINQKVTRISNIPSATRVVLSHNNAKLLVFSDSSNSDSSSVRIINTSDNTVSAPITGFDRAFSAVFSADDSKAYILNCGSECGGTAASVSVLDIASATVTGNVAVSGATVGLLNGSNLYVAGTNSGVGTLSVVDTNNLANAPKSFAISDGLHTRMALASNGKLYIGARTCTNGCLSFFDTAAQTPAIGATNGDVSSILPIKDRSVVYVIEGGDLKVYDTATDALQSKQISITGALSDMNELD